MRLYRLSAPGSLDNLRCTTADEPRPGVGEVLVRMRAASLNYRDLLMVNGRGRNPTGLKDLIPLSDGAGEVAEVGSGVTRLKIGDRVIPNYRQSWIGGELTEREQRTTLGGAVHGVLAEYAVFHEDGLVHLPDHLSFEEGATLPCVALTAWSAVTVGGGLHSGESVLLQGTGGVSIFALQFARLLGARTIVISSRDEKLARARALGASDGLNYRDNPEWQKEVRTLTAGRGVDRVVEVGGEATLTKSIAAVRQNGTIVIIGTVAGGGEVRLTPAMLRVATLQPISVGPRQSFEAMNRAIAMHLLRPVIDKVFPFDEAAAAYRHLAAQDHFGKIVISIEE